MLSSGMSVFGIMKEKAVELFSRRRASHPFWDIPFWERCLRFISHMMTRFSGNAVKNGSHYSLFLRIRFSGRAKLLPGV